MKQILYKEYGETKKKYLKFSSRLSRKQKNGSFQKLSFAKQQQLIYRIKKLYNRLLWLKHLLKLSVAGATFSLAMAVQTNAQNITSGKIFKQKIKHPIANVRNFESDIFVQETGVANPFGTINPFDGQIIPNGTDARLVDIDNDGDLDVFAYQETSLGSGNYSIKFYRNIGNKSSATLLESQSYAFGVYFQSKPYMSFVDLDNDGDQDAVIITNGGNTISFFENTGSAFVEHFGTENPFYLFSATAMRYLSFADIDNDGDQDFFMQDYTGMMLYRNIGTVDSAAFTPENADSLFQAPITNYVNSFILEDVDGDNDFDGILNGNYYFVNTGNVSDPYFIEVTNSTNPFQNVEVNSGSVLTFSDIDNDSDIDLLVSNSNFFIYYENTGSINYPLFENKSNNFNSYMICPDFVDIDNDGDYDMFLSEYDYSASSYHIKFYKNIGSAQNPVFEKQTNLNNPLAGIYSDYFMPLDFVDIDMDGDKDMFLGNYYAPSMRFFKNIGTATNPLFEEKTGNENPLSNVVGQMCFPDFVDIDGDGDQDCFYLAYDTTNGNWMSKFMRNTGNIYNPVFQEDNNPIPIPPDCVFLPEFVDIDNDGDYDVFAGIYLYNYNYLWQIKFYKNTGNIYNPVFQEQPQNDNPLDIENLIPFISFVDIDNDGDKDCFIANSDGYNGQILFFRNKTINNTVQSAVKESKLVVYPNPSNGVFEYNKESFGNIPVNITVTDVSGKLVTEMKQVANGRIDISHLEKGVYILTIANRQQIRKSKIVIK